MTASSTAIVVAYATRSLDLSWLPRDVPLVVVHNDDQLADGTVEHPLTRHLHPGENVGFGAAVNLAVADVSTHRIVLVNPDVVLTGEQWASLDSDADDEVRTLPLVDDEGIPTSVVSGYPTPLTHLAGGLRLGRFAPRGGALRRVASGALGGWGRAHADSLADPAGRWPLTERWVSGAVMSLARSRFEAVDGFDSRYFLYYEDVDLCARLARAFPAMEAVVVSSPPGRHRVGGSDTAADRRVSAAERHRLTSAITYSRGHSGAAWTTTSTLLESRARWHHR